MHRKINIVAINQTSIYSKERVKLHKLKGTVIATSLIFLILLIVACRGHIYETIPNSSKLSPEILEAIENENVNFLSVFVEILDFYNANDGGAFEYARGYSYFDEINENGFNAVLPIGVVGNLTNFSAVKKVRLRKVEEKIDDTLLQSLNDAKVSDEERYELLLWCIPNACNEKVLPKSSVGWTQHGPQSYLGVLTKREIKYLAQSKNIVKISQSEAPIWHIREMINRSTREEGFVTISKSGDLLGLGKSGYSKTFSIINNEADWSYWNTTFGYGEISAVNFSNESVIAVYQGRKSTGGYKIEIMKINFEEDKILVYVKEISPPGGVPVSAAITGPYHIVKTKKIDRRVVFINESG